MAEERFLRERYRTDQLPTPQLCIIAGAWTIFAVIWVCIVRVGPLELDEAGYSAGAHDISLSPTFEIMRNAVNARTYGPGQGVLSIPLIRLFGPNRLVLIWQSIGFGAITIFATGVIAHTFGGRRAAVWAATAVALSAPLFQVMTTALTIPGSVAMGTVSIACLAASDGLRNRRRVICAGAAIGLAVLVRSMSIVMVIPVAVLAVLWAWRHRTPLRVAAASAACALGAAFVVAGWWWLPNWSEVIGYLTTGSADAAASADDSHLFVAFREFDKAVHAVWPTFPINWLPVVITIFVLAAAGSGLADWRRSRRARVEAAEVSTPPLTQEGSDERRQRRPIATTIGGSVAIAWLSYLAITAASLVEARGSALYMAPLIIATIASYLVRPSARRYATGIAVLVLLSGAVTAAGLITGGARDHEVLCPGGIADGDQPCRFRDRDAAREWLEAQVVLATSTVKFLEDAREANPDQWYSFGAHASDIAFNSNNISLEVFVADLEPRLDSGILGSPMTDDKYPRVRKDAGAVVVVPYDPAVPEHERILNLVGDDPDVVRDKVLALGFRRCPGVRLPDGRRAEILVNPDLDGCPDLPAKWRVGA